MGAARVAGLWWSWGGAVLGEIPPGLYFLVRTAYGEMPLHPCEDDLVAPPPVLLCKCTLYVFIVWMHRVCVQCSSHFVVAAVVDECFALAGLPQSSSRKGTMSPVPGFCRKTNVSIRDRRYSYERTHPVCRCL